MNWQKLQDNAMYYRPKYSRITYIKYKKRYKPRSIKDAKHSISDKFARELTRNATAEERSVYRTLKKIYNHKLKILFQYPLHLQKNFFILDIFIRKAELCIEIDGRHHKEDKKQRERDKFRDSQLAEIGIRTERITNQELRNDYREVINRITGLIKVRLSNVSRTNKVVRLQQLSNT